MPMTRLISLLSACVLLALAGCGDDENEAGGGGPSPGSGEATAVQEEADEAPAASATNTIKDFTYNPDPAVVKAGGAITWTNEDTAAHNVIFDDDSVKSIDNLDQGQSGEVTFEQPGTYPYVCSYHSGMKGTVEVQ